MHTQHSSLTKKTALLSFSFILFSSQSVFSNNGVKILSYGCISTILLGSTSYGVNYFLKKGTWLPQKIKELETLKAAIENNATPENSSLKDRTDALLSIQKKLDHCKLLSDGTYNKFLNLATGSVFVATIIGGLIGLSDDEKKINFVYNIPEKKS